MNPPLKMTKALVTGATGFIGKHLVKQLVDLGVEVTCLIRATSNRLPLDPFEPRYVFGDLANDDAIKRAIKSMIALSDEEMAGLLQRCHESAFQRGELLSEPGKIPDKIFFISKGVIRVALQDNSGAEHTLHFALENEFIADYAQFIRKQPALYALQALEETQTVVLPRSAVEWGYDNLREGQKLGRLIAEYYFIYQDNRISNTYIRSPRERYDQISEVFPNIHNRVPQHMIASYLGISSVHLSRLKKQGRQKT